MASRASQRRQSSSGHGSRQAKPAGPPMRYTSNKPSLPLRHYVMAALLFLIVSASVYLYMSSRRSLFSEDWSVYERGLITSDLSYKAVLSDYGGSLRINTTKRHFNNSVLAYVTPWNSKGYDMAKMFRHKFTHISPVWYQLTCQDTVKLLGRHDADQEWVESVRVEGRPMILPRISMEGARMDTVLAQQDIAKHAIQTITSECKNMFYDGVVLEAWNGWAYSGILDNPILRQKALHFVRDLALALHRVPLPRPNRKMKLIFVIPPPSEKEDAQRFTATEMKMLGKYVDGFSLMTYDYSNAYRPGPNAPLPWVQGCLRLLLGSKQDATRVGHDDKDDNDDDGGLHPKLLMGLNFYGNDFILPKGGGPIMGHEYISRLKKHKPELVWDEKASEHYFQYVDGKRHVVFYPSPKSLALRMEEANKWGAGLSIWEIGQGLEYFFDLL